MNKPNEELSSSNVSRFELCFSELTVGISILRMKKAYVMLWDSLLSPASLKVKANLTRVSISLQIFNINFDIEPRDLAA